VVQRRNIQGGVESYCRLKRESERDYCCFAAGVYCMDFDGEGNDFDSEGQKKDFESIEGENLV